jgi:hypothetical protein
MLICFDRHFSETNVRAIDQIWYKRAVEQYEVESDSFVYSVPFDSGKHCSCCLRLISVAQIDSSWTDLHFIFWFHDD